MENTKTNAYLLVFSDGDSLEIEAETLPLAVRKAGKKFNMLGLARFSVNGGSYIEIVVEKRTCGCFQSVSARIPCTCALVEAERKAA